MRTMWLYDYTADSNDKDTKQFVTITKLHVCFSQNLNVSLNY